LAGSQAINGICPTILYESVKKNTETKIISYEIGIKEGGYPALGSAYFHALIPKIGNEYSVEVDVQTEPFINNK
jgi:hypothetical protein